MTAGVLLQRIDTAALRENGVETTSVIESKVDNIKTPDSVMAESGQALEFKILDSFGRNSIKNNLRSARKQADNVALDLRGSRLPLRRPWLT